MTIARPTFAVLALSVVASLPLVARGNLVTVRLEISGAELTQPLVVTDQAILDLSNVYQGAFLGPVTNAIDPAWPRYVVSFVAEARKPFPMLERIGVQRIYVAYYAKNPENDEGFVYLPARGEDGYRNNIGIITRDGHDGSWHQAFPTWAELLNSYLPRG